MKRTLMAVNHRRFPAGRYFLLFLLWWLARVDALTQGLPAIDADNGLVPGCATAEQALQLTLNGSNFASQAQVRIRGTTFAGELLLTPAAPPSATRITIALPAGSTALADPGRLTIDVQQPDAAGGLVYSNAVQLPVYPKTGPISGAVVACGNSKQNYTVARLAGAASYEWAVVSGSAAIVAGSNTNSARISFGNTAGTVQLAVTTLHACGTAGTTSTLEVAVNAVPTLSLEAFGPVCVNAPAFALAGGSPAGGTFTVDGVVAASFDPAAAGVGTHSIAYYYTQNGCTVSTTQTISVLAAPEVTFTAPFSPVCVNAAPFPLAGGAPAGGSYSGPGVSGGTFDPAAAGVGTHTITYTGSQEVCRASAVQTITVLPPPAVSLETFGPVCANAPAFAFAGGSPAGGTYSVDGVVAASFDPAAAGVGTYTVIYTVSQQGCSSSATRTLRVLAAPEASFALPFNPVCVNAAPFPLAGGTPAGGSYSGPGVSGGTFDPAAAGVGTHTITYTGSQNGCSDSTTQDIIVLDAPAAGITAPAGGAQACPGAFVALSATTTGAAYQWLLNGEPIAGAVNDSLAAGRSGSYQVQVTAGGCTAVSDGLEVIILDAANIILAPDTVSFCAGDNVRLKALAGSGYQYQWYRNGEPAGADHASLSVNQAGDYYVVLRPGDCLPITSAVVTVSETPQIADNAISTPETVICTGATILLSGSEPTGGKGPGTYTYQWRRRVNGGRLVAISGATSRDYTYVTGTFSGAVAFLREVTSDLCTNASAPVDITVNQVIGGNTIAAPAQDTICAGQTPGTITGSPVSSFSDPVYSWESRPFFGSYSLIPGATSADYNPPALSRTTIFRRLVRAGACTSISNPDTIFVLPAIAGNTIAAPGALICGNAAAGTLASEPLPGDNGSYSYGWESSTDGLAFSPIPGATDAAYDPGVLAQTTTFRRLVTAGACTDTSNALTITPTQPITGNSIRAAADRVCRGTAAAAITGEPVAGGTGTYSYGWESSTDGLAFSPIPGATDAAYDPGVLAQTTTFRRLVTAGACTDTSNALTIAVDPVASYTVLLTVLPGLPVCGETQYSAVVIRNVSLVRFPADARHQQVTWEGGEQVTGQFVFDWWKNDAQSLQTGTTGSAVTLPGLQPGEYYTVRARPVSEPLACAILNNRPDLVPAGAGASLLFSNRIYSGHPEGYGLSITADLQGPICPGTAVTFRAFPNDPAYANPTYQWLVNQQEVPGASQPFFTATDLADGDVVSVRFNSGENDCSPVTANPISLQLMVPVLNRIAGIQGPMQRQVGEEATYQVIPADNTLGWRYQWTLTYADGRQETAAETGARLTIARVPADLEQVAVTQIAPAGNCVDLASTTLAVLNEPLPITLLYLKASKKGRVAVLKWATAMEQHNAGFEVQVSADAYTYRSLGFVPSKAPHSLTRQVYTFSDPEKGQYGTRYYRLKQVDLNGDFQYHGPATVKMQEPTVRVLAYPNPFTTVVLLEIEAPEAGQLELLLLNALGSKLAEHRLPLQQGINKAELRPNFHLPAGVYTILLSLNGRSHRLSLLKQ